VLSHFLHRKLPGNEDKIQHALSTRGGGGGGGGRARIGFCMVRGWAQRGRRKIRDVLGEDALIAAPQDVQELAGSSSSHACLARQHSPVARSR